MGESLPDSEVDVDSLQKDIEDKLSDESRQIDFLEELHQSQTG